MGAIPTNKIEIRNFFKKKLSEEYSQFNSIELLGRWNTTISLFIQSFGIDFINQKWGVFLPLKDEPQILQILQAKFANIAYPKVNGSSLDFCLNPKTFVKGVLGNQEPNEGTKLSQHELAGVFVPGLVFDRSGNRLGRGKGYYDQFLKNFSGLKVGVCHQLQVINDLIPVDEWDIKMDFILTENEVIKMGFL